MRHPDLHRLLFLVLLGLGVLGCSKSAPPAPPAPPSAETPVAATSKQEPAPPAGAGSTRFPAEALEPAKPARQPELPTPGAPVVLELTVQEKYDAALLEAVTLLAEHRTADALKALQAAQALQNTDQIRREIERGKRRLEQETAAERTTLDIQTVLADGKPAEAARLATAALQQYGQLDAADRLVKLKRQADALLATEDQDQAARRQRARQEAEVALKEKNLRAAALALETVLQFGDDPPLKQQLADTQAALARYDEHRQRAAELRRDPANLEDALAALEEAAKAWDTLQVRQEIDEYTLALQTRRDRLGVADFEVRGDVGVPLIGRTVAEELLPAFKSRYDLVERTQLHRVAGELKLEADDLFENADGRQELGRLAKVRYLVLGSVARLGSLTVHARLVDVRTGLIVQTAKIVARTPEELTTLLPQLAHVLMLTDEQKIADEQRRAQLAVAPPRISIPASPDAPLPPAPEVSAKPAPPVIIYTAKPPELGGLRPDDFDLLPPPPPPHQPPPVVVQRPQPVQQRLLHVSVELGDSLFRSGRYREAQVHFDLALSLDPYREDLRVRLDRCRPYLPPPPPPPPPRVAVLSFIEGGDPALVPPGAGAWVAENLAPYYWPPYQVVDRGEVYYYMSRLGLTLRDLIHDPAARRWLARALNLRAFVLGTVLTRDRVSPPIQVTAYLMDAEFGYELGRGRIIVEDRYRLKLRLRELARLTLLDPRERLRVEQEAEAYQLPLRDGRRCYDRGEFTLAIDFYRRASKLRPDSIEIAVLLQQAEQRARQLAWEDARRRDWERQQTVAVVFQQRGTSLLREVEAARIRAEQEAAALAGVERRLRDQQRERAYDQLMVRGRLAFEQRNFTGSIQLFESAVALRPNDAAYRELALARKQLQETEYLRAADERARREAGLRRQREAELAALQAKLADERRRREAEDKARREVQEARDQAAYTKLLDEAQKAQGQGKFEDAVAALQSARRLRPSDEVDRLLAQVLVERVRAKKDDEARRKLEARLVEERDRRLKAEAEASRNKELYDQALAAALKAMAEKRYDVATTRFQEAGKLFRTDAVRNGLKQAEEARAKETAAADADRKKQEDDKKRTAELKRLMSEGQLAMAAKRYELAVKHFTAATKMAPGDVEAIKALVQAEQARDKQAAEARKPAPPVASKPPAEDAAKAEMAAKNKTLNEYQSLVKSGREALAAKKYDDAVRAFSQAAKLMPDVPVAGQLLKDAEKARTEAMAVADKEAKAKAAKDAEAKKDADKRQREFIRLLTDGEKAVKAKRYEEAVKAFDEAVKIRPEDAGAIRSLRDARQALATAQTEARAAREAEMKKETEAKAKAAKEAEARAKATKDADMKKEADAKAAKEAEMKKEAQKKLQDFVRLLSDGEKAMKAKRYEDAVKAYQGAVNLQPNDTGAAKALKEARKALEEAKKPVAMPAEYTKQMAEGEKALKAKRYKEAVKAFEAALKAVPNDPEATKLLKQAKEGK